MRIDTIDLNFQGAQEVTASFLRPPNRPLARGMCP